MAESGSFNAEGGSSHKEDRAFNKTTEKPYTSVNQAIKDESTPPLKPVFKKSVPASVWRASSDNELEILQSSLANMMRNTQSHADNSPNAKYADVLDKIIAVSTPIKGDGAKGKMQFETSEAFKQSMQEWQSDLGGDMTPLLYEVKEYLLKLQRSLKNLKENAKQSTKGVTSSALDSFVKEALALGGDYEKERAFNNEAKATTVTYKEVPKSSLNTLSLSEISSLVKAEIEGGGECERSEEAASEITTPANFKVVKSEAKKEPEALSPDQLLEKAQKEALAIFSQNNALNEPLACKNQNLPGSLSDTSGGVKVSLLSDEAFYSQDVNKDLQDVYIHDDLESLSDVLIKVNEKPSELSHVRHQNNNPDFISQELSSVLSEVLEKNSNEPQALEPKMVKEDKQNQASVDMVPVEQYESALALSPSDDPQAIPFDDEEIENEVVGGNDFASFDLHDENKDKFLVDGRPTQDTSFEAEIYLEDNRALGRELQPADFYDQVLKQDKWLQDIFAVGFSHGPVYAALSYTSRHIDVNDSEHWVLDICEDFRMMAEDQSFLNTLVEKFSLLKNRDLKINFNIVKGLPEGCPEMLSRQALSQAVVDARIELASSSQIRALIETLGDDLNTVNLSLYTQLPANKS